MSLHVESLTELGFTQLEAEVYVFLLQAATATGYGVAKALGRPTANTYKAIATLEAKGAVMVDDGETRVCRAVPAHELLARLDREFQARRVRAESSLESLHGGERDDRVYQLRTRAQVIERARSMLGRARERVLVDAFPDTLPPIAGALEETAARGVAVTVLVYELDLSLDGVELVLVHDAPGILDAWPGHQLNLNVDAEEHLLALLEPEEGGVLQATWSHSPYLSCLHYSGTACEITVQRARAARAAGLGEAGIGRALDAGDGLLLSGSSLPGYLTLRRLLDEARGPMRQGAPKGRRVKAPGNG